MLPAATQPLQTYTSVYNSVKIEKISICVLPYGKIRTLCFVDFAKSLRKILYAHAKAVLKGLTKIKYTLHRPREPDVESRGKCEQYCAQAVVISQCVNYNAKSVFVLQVLGN